jgi:predicted AlkP superfamily pyrophosphatase or phosphodiesterase
VKGIRAAIVLLATLAPLGVAAEPVVILISWDGVRHDYPDRARFPALERMAREGLRAGRLVPVFPSNTFPGHVSLATGTYPDRHGIVDNRFLDRERGIYAMSDDASFIAAEPLWVAAERQGVRSAAFFWVGSGTDWRGRGATYRVAPFDSDVGEAEKVAKILAWLDLPADERPRLVLSWWHGADRVGHRMGPDHADVAAALAEQDEQLGVLLAGLDARAAWDETTLLLVSDHGMTEVSETVPVEETLAAAGVESELVLGTAVAHVFLDEPASLPRAEAALRALPNVAVYHGDALPSSLRLGFPSRTGDLVLTTTPPRTFRDVSTAEHLLLAAGGLAGWKPGLHGYDPELPDMGAIFFAMGRGIPPGARPERVRMIDVAATVAELLGIAPPLQSEGRPIAGLTLPLAPRQDALAQPQ